VNNERSSSNIKSDKWLLAPYIHANGESLFFEWRWDYKHQYYYINGKCTL